MAALDNPLYEQQKQFYTKKEADRILEYLDTLQYEDSFRFSYNHLDRMPRKMKWFADDPKHTYVFSQAHVVGLQAHPFTEELNKIRDKIQTYTGRTFNALLINVYNPSDSIAYHSDDDKWYEKDFIVPSLSFGATRDFLLREKATQIENKTPIKTIKLKLEHGDLVIMKAGCQKRYNHSVPARLKSKGLRYNLTFRSIVSNVKPKARTWDNVQKAADEGKLGRGREHFEKHQKRTHVLSSKILPL